MDLKQLRYFVAIVDAGSISRASRILHIAQPALSAQIANLEAELRVQLLHRNPFGVVPTEQGRVFYASAQRVVREMRRVAEEVRSADRNPVGEAALGCLHSAANIVSRPFIQRLIERYPQVRLEYAAGQSVDLYRGLTAGTLDLVLVYKDSDVDGVQSEPLLKEELLLAVGAAASHALPGSPHLSDLKDTPFIFPRASHFSIRRLVEDAFGREGLTPTVLAQVDSLPLIKALVSDSIACTVLPWSAMHEVVETGRIVCRPIRDALLTREIELCQPADRPVSPAVMAARELFVQTIRELIHTGRWRHASLRETAASGAKGVTHA